MNLFCEWIYQVTVSALSSSHSWGLKARRRNRARKPRWFPWGHTTSQDQSRTEVFRSSGLHADCCIVAPLCKSTTDTRWGRSNSVLIPWCCASPSLHLPPFSLYIHSSIFFPLASTTLLKISANPGKNPQTLRMAPFQSRRSSMGSASGDVGSAVTNAQAGTTTQTLPTGEEFVLCPDTTGTVPPQSKRTLK